jgi:DNA (cytosine-5)-methyltransferase 1
VRPRLLDLFCGAGGAAVGYHRAGFDVVGVDIVEQPNYPFEFWQDDALKIASDYSVTRVFDAIHASPPCQAHTLMQAVAKNTGSHEDLIGPTRELLEATGLPYVIENVVGAPLLEPFRLCGSSFGLGVYSLNRELRRHRLFETNWPIGMLPACHHTMRSCGIYGDHFRMGRRSADGEFSGAQALAYGSEAMGIGWMTWPELVQSIPPAYTEFIGAQLLAHVVHTRSDAGQEVMA